MSTYSSAAATGGDAQPAATGGDAQPATRSLLRVALKLDAVGFAELHLAGLKRAPR